jgi:hypothetical protein
VSPNSAAYVLKHQDPTKRNETLEGTATCSGRRATGGVCDARPTILSVCDRLMCCCVVFCFVLFECNISSVTEREQNTHALTHHSVWRVGSASACLDSYNILSNILLSRLSPIGDHQCGFRSNGFTTDQIFCIRQILEEKWEYNGTVHQLFIDFKKACDSVGREVLYSILVEIAIPMKLG